MSITRLPGYRQSTARFVGSPRFEGFEGAAGVVREGSGLPSTDEDDGQQGAVSNSLSATAATLMHVVPKAGTNIVKYRHGWSLRTVCHKSCKLHKAVAGMVPAATLCRTMVAVQHPGPMTASSSSCLKAASVQRESAL